MQFARLVEDCNARDYNLGTSKAYGILTSPVIRPPASVSAPIYISFNYFYQVEPNGRDYDRMYFQISVNGGTWKTVWSRSVRNGPTDCGIAVYTLTTKPSYFQVRFVFDSVDYRYNNYKGWVVDNVMASTAPPPTAGATVPLGELQLLAGDPAAEFNVVNVPNPITDVHTTTFKVLGPMAELVEEIRVRIFDLSGRLVWEGQAYGSSLDWHTDDFSGRYLANGIYIYQVQVRVAGTWITTELKKLAIFR